MERKCFYGDHLVDLKSRLTWHRVVGWERKGNNGGSDITLREPRDEYACDVCVMRIKRGVAPTQGNLL